MKMRIWVSMLALVLVMSVSAFTFASDDDRGSDDKGSDWTMRLRMLKDKVKDGRDDLKEKSKSITRSIRDNVKELKGERKEFRKEHKARVYYVGTADIATVNPILQSYHNELVQLNQQFIAQLKAGSGGALTGTVRTGAVWTWDVWTGAVWTGDVFTGGIRTGGFWTWGMRTGGFWTGWSWTGGTWVGNTQSVLNAWKTATLDLLTRKWNAIRPYVDADKLAEFDALLVSRKALVEKAFAKKIENRELRNERKNLRASLMLTNAEKMRNRVKDGSTHAKAKFVKHVDRLIMQVDKILAKGNLSAETRTMWESVKTQLSSYSASAGAASSAKISSSDLHDIAEHIQEAVDGDDS